MAKNSTQITIRSRTQGEWNLIMKKICPDGEGEMQCISRHIRKEVLRIKNQLRDLPESIESIGGKKIEKRPYLDNAIIADIRQIALQIKVEPSTIIDRLIITPLLNNY